MAADGDRRAFQLTEFATQDIAGGSGGWAPYAAPTPPRSLEAAARQRLSAGDWAGARTLLEQAVEREPANASLWLSLTAALRGLRRSDEEMAALNTCLALQPRNLQALLQAAQLHEMKGDLRTSAATYRMALQSIPAGTDLSPQLRPLLQRARAAIDANNLALENYLQERLAGLRARHAGESFGRFDKAVDTLLLKRRVYRPQPSFLYFPHLPAIEFHERGDFPWLDAIEAATDDIRNELLQVMAEDRASLEPYISASWTANDAWGALNHSHRWDAYFFWREGVALAANLARCPRTVAALEAWPPCDLPGCAPTAMFSILDAGARIPPHVGVNNCRLVVHLPLIVPPDCGFRVGAETRQWEPGKAFVFDDTIEHEAWNDSGDWRAILILDIWNPALSLAERDLVRALTAGIDEYYGALPEYVQPIQRPN